MRWIKEETPIWDRSKESVIGCADFGTFEIIDARIGEQLPGEWWRLIDDDGTPIAIGWIDTSDEVFEISLAVAEEQRGKGVGASLLSNLEIRARELGYQEIVGIVKKSNPNATKMITWLYKNGFSAEWLGISGIYEQISMEKALNLVLKTDISLVRKLSK